MDNSTFWWQAAGVDPGPGPDAGDPIGQSLRFRGEQYLERTLGASESTTYSFWCKLGDISKVGYFISSSSSGTNVQLVYQGVGSWDLGADNTGSQYAYTANKLRDPGAWYHVLYTRGATNTRIFINGKEATYALEANGAGGTLAPTNVRIGSVFNGSYGSLDGYMAAVYFIDGQALEPTAFGRFNSQGVWVPVDPQGLTYGSNGFKLTFEDASNIGKDYSGNGNDFTATGFDLTPPGIWSTGLSAEDGLLAGYDPADAFDGDTGTQVFGVTNGGWMRFAPTTPITVNSEVAWFSNSSATNPSDGTTNFIRWNGTDVDRVFRDWTVVPGAGEISVDNPIEFIGSGSKDPIDTIPSVNAIRVDGTILVDSTGTDYDLMQDSPTQNYATWNPLIGPASGGLATSTWQLKDANLAAGPGNVAGASDATMDATIASTNQDVYLEVTIKQNNNTIGFGYLEPGSRLDGDRTSPSFFRAFSSDCATKDGGSDFDNSNLGINPIGQTFGFHIDVAGGKVDVYNQSSLVGTSTGWTFTDTRTLFIGSNGAASGKEVTVNFGQQPFITRPAGLSDDTDLQTQNLPTDPLPDEITGTFTGNNSSDGPFVYTGCVPGRIQYGSVDVTYDQRLGQTNVDFLSNGFKIRSTTSNSGTVNYTVTTTHTGGEYDGKKIPFYLPAPATSN